MPTTSYDASARFPLSVVVQPSSLRANYEKLLSFPFMIEMEKLAMTSFDFPVSLTRMIHKKYHLVLVVDFKLVFYPEIRSK